MLNLLIKHKRLIVKQNQNFWSATTVFSGLQVALKDKSQEPKKCIMKKKQIKTSISRSGV